MIIHGTTIHSVAQISLAENQLLIILWKTRAQIVDQIFINYKLAAKNTLIPKTAKYKSVT